jgi:hypothetical protein
MGGKVFKLVEGTFDAEGLEAGLEWSGFHIQDDRGVSVRYSEASEFDLTIFYVASYRSDILQRPEFDPGEVLVLVPEPTNFYDKSAVGVWDKTRRLKVGYVPREDNEYIRAALTLPGTVAVALAEHRKSNKRVSLTVLFGPLGIK